MGYWPARHYDIVFCIDVSFSMASRLDAVKKFITEFAASLWQVFPEYCKSESEIRGRVVTFDRCLTNSKPVYSSSFLTLFPRARSSDFSHIISGLSAGEPGEEVAENVLQALSICVDSDWVGVKGTGEWDRHIVVVFTDAGTPHVLIGAESRQVPTTSEKSVLFESIRARWDGRVDSKLHQYSKRLVLFTPDTTPWKEMADSWSDTVMLPSSAGEGMTPSEFRTILDVCLIAPL